jgi:hypothetical protein
MLPRTAVYAIAALSLACSKDDTKASPAPEASSVAQPSAGAAPSASGASTPGAPVAAGSSSTSTAAPAASPGAASSGTRAPPGGVVVASASAAPSAAPLVASASAAPSASAPAAPPAKPVASRTASPRYTIDFSAPGNCTAGNDCAATLHIEALGAYHVNDQYKFRFVPTDAAGVTFSGGAPGDFAMQGAKAGTMSLRFKASQAGTVTVAGTFKICVCTESECQPEQVAVSLAVPIG